MLTCPERSHIMLFSIFPIMSTLLSEIEIRYLGNKDYFRKLFLAVVAVNVNAADVKDLARALVEPRNKTLAGSMDEHAETIPV